MPYAPVPYPVAPPILPADMSPGPRFPSIRSGALEGSPHYKRRRTRPSQSPAANTSVHSNTGGLDVDGIEPEDFPVGGDDSFASGASRSWDQCRVHADCPDESLVRAPVAKKIRSMSRAVSVASSGSIDSAGEIKLYTCPYPVCHRPFRRLEHLRRHVRTHTQERPYACNRCPRRFARQDNLTNHLRIHDKAEREGLEADFASESEREMTGSPAPDMS